MRSYSTLALTVFVAACSVATRPVAQPRATPAPESRLFAMQSNFWVNLHHFLYVTARARRGLGTTRPAVTSALADPAGFSALRRVAAEMSTPRLVVRQ